jgi:hypothetical protein
LRRREFRKPPVNQFSDLQQVTPRPLGSRRIALLGKRHILGGEQRNFQEQLPGGRRRTALKEARFIWRVRLIIIRAGARLDWFGGIAGKLGHGQAPHWMLHKRRSRLR